MNRKPKIIRNDDYHGRTIVISDLHGSLQTYQKLLEKVHYVPGQDQLILLGDLVEKGPENLKLLRTVMKQCEMENIIVLMGNCDFVAKNILYSYRLEFLKSVLLSRSNSLIHEMIQEASLDPLSESTDMEQLARELRKRYLPELSFLNDLPHVLITPSRIYAHSGIRDEQTIADDFREVMARFQFALEDHCFTRMVIVGHMPVSEYSRRIASFTPIIDRQTNIISIDGGCMVKKAGQLNALIFEDGVITTESADLLPQVRAVHSTHPDNPAPFYLNWNQGDVEILERKDSQSLVFSKWLHRRFWIDNEFLDHGKGTNYTNYEMPLRKGQQVTVVNLWGHKAQIKVHGILGWTDQNNLELDEKALMAGFDHQ